jgi:hypothetical protein
MLKLVKGYFDEIFKSVKRLKAWGSFQENKTLQERKPAKDDISTMSEGLYNQLTLTSRNNNLIPFPPKLLNRPPHHPLTLLILIALRTVFSTFPMSHPGEC